MTRMTVFFMAISAPAFIPGGQTVVHRIRITSSTVVLSLLGFSLIILIHFLDDLIHGFGFELSG